MRSCGGNLMKKKVIGIAALCAMMGLSGCNLLSSQSCVHSWSPWEIDEEATCTERGSRSRYCEKCGKEQVRSIPVDTTAHLWMDDKASDRAATCTEKGIEGSQYCFRCFTRKKGNDTEYSGHVWEVADTTGDPKYKEATCLEDGLYQKKCHNCTATEDVVIPKSGHLAGRPDNSGGVVGVVRCSREGCGELMAYQLDIVNAQGYNTPTVRMNKKSGEDGNKAVWDISSCIDTVIPAGSYDIQLEAAMTDSSHGNRKMYNMAREDLMVDGDREGNTTNGTPDKVTESPYRYFVKVDATTYYPTTKESFQDLGLTVGASNTKYVEFLKGVNINKESTTLSLIHGDIGYSLFIKSIRFVPHVHVLETETVNPASGRAGYKLEKCNLCGYRKITIDANTDSVVTHKDEGAPNGYLRLAGNGDSVTYKINVDESITGSLFMVGRQLASDMEQTPYNITVKNNTDDITGEWAGKKSSDFLKAEGDTGLANYSEEGRILLGEITLKENVEYGTNELTITRTGDYNIAMSKLVIEGRPTGHIHKLVHDASQDVAATCRTNKQEYYKCSCGQYELRTIEGTMLPHNLYEYSRAEASCDYEGSIIYKCSNPGCTYNETVKIPKSHDMVTATPPEGATYELKECGLCHNAKEATWMLEQSMIEDYDEGTSSYAQTTASAKSGKTSSGEDFSVFKFDTAKRRVRLSYENDSGNYVTAKLSMFATTKASNIASCQVYQQTIGQESSPAKKFNINVNNEDLTVGAALRNKTIGDLGLKNVESQLNDNGALADPMWLEYIDVDLAPGMNSIIIETPTKTQYSMYVGGFRLSY